MLTRFEGPVLLYLQLNYQDERRCCELKAYCEIATESWTVQFYSFFEFYKVFLNKSVMYMRITKRIWTDSVEVKSRYGGGS